MIQITCCIHVRLFYGSCLSHRDTGAMCGVGNRSIEGRTPDIHRQRGSESPITKYLEAGVSIDSYCVFRNTSTVASALCVYIVTVNTAVCVCHLNNGS